ncbi:hypothetical protein [Jatrophihabitans sp.]|uniref:hypothetical protein n=1 Tax=Jatrophihabitans sp. TaxID=1932789 RepID=UPI0030C74F7E
MRTWVVRTMTYDGELHGVLRDVASGRAYPFASRAELLATLAEPAPGEDLAVALTTTTPPPRRD